MGIKLLLKKHFTLSGRLAPTIIFAAGLMVVIMFLAGFAGRLHWRLDMLSHFRVQYIVSLFLLSFTLLIIGRKLWAVILLIPAILISCLIVPDYIKPDENEPFDEKQYRILQYNVKRFNEDYDRFLKYVGTEQPDMILLLEVSDAWAEGVKDLHDIYPYWCEFPEEGYGGATFYSAYQLRECRSTDFNGSTGTSIHAEANLEGRWISILGIHLDKPTHRKGYDQRALRMENISRHVSSIKTPVILMGDFNSTPWCDHFKSFAEEVKLRDSRKGFGIQPSFPTYWYMAPFRIPIDHFFVSDDIIVVDRRVGPDIGSDHFPVIMDFSIRDNQGVVHE
jgi:endonuclease/exonuclease/phosphatase (EEP) superfamily protein YafD